VFELVPLSFRRSWRVVLHHMESAPSRPPRARLQSLSFHKPCPGNRWPHHHPFSTNIRRSSDSSAETDNVPPAADGRVMKHRPPCLRHPYPPRIAAFVARRICQRDGFPPPPNSGSHGRDTFAAAPAAKCGPRILEVARAALLLGVHADHRQTPCPDTTSRAAQMSAKTAGLRSAPKPFLPACCKSAGRIPPWCSTGRSLPPAPA